MSIVSLLTNSCANAASSCPLTCYFFKSGVTYQRAPVNLPLSTVVIVISLFDQHLPVVAAQQYREKGFQTKGNLQTHRHTALLEHHSFPSKASRIAISTASSGVIALWTSRRLRPSKYSPASLSDHPPCPARATIGILA